MSNMVVQTNVLALNSHRNMKTIGANMQKASSRLASGYRINSAADDAAGLAISEKMRAQIRGLDMASKNAQDASSLIQTAEGGMQEIDNMLQRARELVNQASNDSNEQAVDRDAIQEELNSLVAEIDAMADRVEFNKKTLLDGSWSAGGKTAVTGPNATVLNSIGTVIKNLSAAKVSYATAGKAESLGYTKALSASKVLANPPATATSKSLSQAAANLAIYDTNKKHISTYKGLDDKVTSANEVAAELLNRLAADVQDDGEAASTANTLFFQIGANAGQGINVNIESVKSDKLGIGNGQGQATINVKEPTGANITNILATMDTALTHVTTERAKLGAIQNRLEYTQRSLDISSENLSDAESRIRNADMAKEMMNFTKTNVLQQAAVSMLSQANQAPQSVLQLLR